MMKRSVERWPAMAGELPKLNEVPQNHHFPGPDMDSYEFIRMSFAISMCGEARCTVKSVDAGPLPNTCCVEKPGFSMEANF